MRRIFPLAGVMSLGILSTGCASLNNNIPFQYQPALVASKGPIQKSTGFSMLVDSRPEKDRAYTKSIKDVPEKITAKLIEDFRSSGLFSEIHYPPKTNDEIVITGTIKRFKWKLYSRGIAYVPYVGLAAGIFGVPLTRAYGMTEIELELKDGATNRVLGTFSESSEVETMYSIYNFKTGESGAELAESFRDVAKKLKGDITLKLSD